ncbi:hypothetical protein CAPTEDRAFT_202550 [Capitella teleta]|uniref:Protein kinase domain-containing protein n=1 Tax=Capitella teleta TaxID=283909 RepID=R7V5Z7_CAPTE|nr:hypothetical protein CAPTEDRAFT_202550 [Capitella teleta]|eukprot:ELU13907.1 hypothetical protein CAPTEDRAFT_202550 [Capitella teleta]
MSSLPKSVVDYGMTKITQRLRNECALKKCFCNKETSALPAFIRWTAPEILSHPRATEANFDVFSPSCDIYSFGMILWEVVSITDPFEEIADDSEVKDLVCRGGRPRVDLLHNLFSPYLDLMCGCWDHNPDMRPTFKKCAVQLKTILHLCNKQPHLVADNYSLRGSLPNLSVGIIIETAYVIFSEDDDETINF